MMRRWYLIIAIFFSLIAETSAQAATKLESPNVAVGIHVNGIRSISYKNNTFTVDFSLWFRWQGNDLNPHKSFKLPGAKIESIRYAADTLLYKGGARFAVVDIVATFDTKWDINNFPFDKQVLSIRVEEQEAEHDEVLYIADKENIAKAEKLEIQGWEIKSARSFISENRYETNFGDLRIPPGENYHSTQFNYEMRIVRKSWLIGMKLLIAPIVAIFLMNVVLRLPASESSRMSVATAALFALVSSNYIVIGMLPDSEGYSFAEKLITHGLIQSGLYLVGTIASLKHIRASEADAANRIDHRMFYFFTASNVAFVAYAAYALVA